jgi:hypothetical protein
MEGTINRFKNLRYRILWATFFEHMLILIAIVIQAVIPSKPFWVRIFDKRFEHRKKEKLMLKLKVNKIKDN